MAEVDKKDAKKDPKKDGKEAAPEEAPVVAKKSNKMLFIAIGAVFVLLLAIGIPVAILTLNKKPAAPTLEELAATAAQSEAAIKALVPESHSDEDELVDGEEPLGAILPLETFVVNLTGGRYIRCQVQLEFLTRDIPKKFYTRTVLIRDAIITLLTTKAADEITSEKGKDQLRSEIKDVIDENLKKEEVKKVYFTQFVIQ